MLQLLPHVEDATVKGAGHLPASTHPSKVATLLIDFLRRHPGPGVTVWLVLAVVTILRLVPAPPNT